MANILSLGLDASLMETRHKVLERTGARVLSTTPELAFRMLGELQFAVVVICHTVSEEDIVNLCRLVERFCPCSRVVVLETHASSFLGCDRSLAFDWHRGPNAFVELVRDLLTMPIPRLAQDLVPLTETQAA